MQANIMDEWLGYGSVALLSYLLGSINFGLILYRLSTRRDLRDQGSGNVGATNVYRQGKKLTAALTLFLDAGKGMLAVYISYQIVPSATAEIFSCACCMLGHVFPVWLKFKGGKGVATYFGSLSIVSPDLFVLFALTWTLSYLIWRYSSLAALLASSAVVDGWLIMSYPQISPVFFLLLLFTSALLFWTHRANIRRLLSGQEPKIR